MSRKATQKQHAFAMAYLQTGKPSESYRAAGYKCDRMSDGNIADEAQRLLKNPHVTHIIQEGRQNAQERCQVTIESLTEKMWEDREFARECESPQAALNASVAVAKLHRLLDTEAPPAPGVNLTLVLGNIDEDELMRRYAETILLRQQRRKRIAHTGNGSVLN